ncbi:MAG: DNA polymerase III subunit beta [Alphaproteobacteria bacterium]|nr:DNA polymerase III subunit beta [Alphaproteobacteria bacterium]
MKITIERAVLLKALGHVQSVVERRNTIPILSNVRLQAEDGQLSLTATDLDLAVVSGVACDVQQKGGTTAPAHTLYDIVRKLPDGAQIELVHGREDGRLALRSGRSDFALACLPVDDFPVMAEGNLPTKFKLAAQDLRRLIDKTRFAVSTEETRYYLNGVHVHVVAEAGKHVLRAVATDGHRLARLETDAPKGAKDMPGVIVPRKGVTELRKLIDEIDGDVQIALSDTKIRFAAGDMVLTSKLIDGTFPDYQRVIPAGNDKTLTVDPGALAQAVDRVSTISTDRLRSVKLALDRDRVTVSATSPEQGTASEEIAAEYAQAKLEIGFNARYLLDILEQVRGDKAVFRCAEATAPVVVTDNDDVAALYVLMPMRV